MKKPKISECYDKKHNIYTINGLTFTEYQLEEFVGEYMDWCGCGIPDQAVKQLRLALEHIETLQLLVLNQVMTYQEWEKKGKELFGQWEYFIYYILDNTELTEHGGSVPGWLTDNGKDMLKILTKIKEDA